MSDDADILDKFSRYRFQEHDFLPQWRAIQKFVKYHTIGDYTYGDRKFTSARHLQESLDKFAIPTLSSIFQPDESGSSVIAAADDQDLIQLRRLVCAEMQEAILLDDGEATMSDDDEETPGVESTICHWNPNKDIASSSKRRKTQKADHNRSAISYDAGTDQYLTMKKRKHATALSVGTNLLSIANTASFANGLDTRECEKIEAMYGMCDFPRWKFLLYTNHSLILYGNGSKRKIVASFCDTELQEDGSILQVDAIDADVSAASLISLLSKLFHCAADTANTLPIIDQAVRVGKHILKRCQAANNTVFLIIYNLECILQRNPTDLKAIEILSSYLRILATVDDVDTPSYMSRCTSFVWIVLHTQRPYVREMAKLELQEEDNGRQSIRSRQRELSESRIFEVLRNLAPRYAEVMQVLARLQLKVHFTDSAIGSGWVNYKDFREECKNNFLIDKDSKLRSLQVSLV